MERKNPRPAAQAGIEVNARGLDKNFDALQALRDVSFSLKAGETLAVIGPTGAGKSVLLKCLMGLYPVDGGQLVLDGQNVSAAPFSPALRQRIAMLFQHNALFDSLPVWENVAFAPLRRGVPRAEARDAAAQLLRKVGLSAETGALFPAALSGGMQKRVGFARALAADAKLLLLDNPTAGLDPIMARRLESMILRVSRAAGATVITVTADMARVTAQYDRLAVLHAGAMRWFGRARQAATIAQPWVRQLLDGQRQGPMAVAAQV
ncbi:MAG: ATP-binding cassette domain-containing protein [Hyphomicrobiales bacterium]|nr:ATP-binding cassette domain-containing protein [Hyphomicrobiales bacterium]